MLKYDFRMSAVADRLVAVTNDVYFVHKKFKDASNVHYIKIGASSTYSSDASKWRTQQGGLISRSRFDEARKAIDNIEIQHPVHVATYVNGSGHERNVYQMDDVLVVVRSECLSLKVWFNTTLTEIASYWPDYECIALNEATGSRIEVALLCVTSEGPNYSLRRLMTLSLPRQNDISAEKLYLTLVLIQH